MEEFELPNFKKIFTPRNVAKAVVSTSVHFVISTAIEKVVPADTKIDKVKLRIGTYALSSMMVSHVSSFVNEKFDSFGDKHPELVGETAENVIPIPHIPEMRNNGSAVSE